MAEEENNEEVKQSSGGGKAMMIVLIALIVILLLVVGGLGYFLYAKGIFSDQPMGGNQEQMQKEEASDSKQTYKAAINDLVLNITNAKGREKLMKLSFSLKSTEPTIEGIVEEYKPEIVDVVIAQISSRSSEELLTVGGKALLKEELLEDINSIINEVTSSNEDIKENNVKKILFTTFVIK
ncbi:flagellar basal body-associated protein FliL [Arcobacter sp. LA11]|uniref:flagellar basal body-associated FliL family protein n=1 Tax=Arcobacter sp. LA11 TaxID=1898176 RepID=UPI000933F44B|nr:flagellar basal body-associated FliL family protein [Arcobacter sp. LA11]